MLGKFIGRSDELALLEKEYARKGASLVIVFGRRRVGKSRLIEEFTKEKDAFSYLAADEGDTLQVHDLCLMLGEHLGDNFLPTSGIGDWATLFNYLERVWPRDERKVLVIDEITYIVKNSPGFLSQLQRFWDQFLSKTRTCMVLSGSMVGLMVKKVLSYGSPIYGRRSLDILLRPMDLWESCGFLGALSDEDKVRTYCLLGGVPKYLLMAEGGFKELVKEGFLSPNGYFYREGDYILAEEFSGAAVYSNVLRAMAEGRREAGEIAQYVGLDTKRLSAYLHILESLGMIGKDLPVSAKRSRGARYRIDDVMLEFWFRFVSPNKAAIERGRADITATLDNDINAFIGGRFEAVCRQYIARREPVLDIGSWWGRFGGKVEEVDILGLKDGGIVAGECKWASGVNPEAELESLKRKVALLKAKGKVEYYLFAKSFKRGAGSEARCIDLGDLLEG